MANALNKKSTIKVGNRDDQILVINRNVTSQAEYNKELGRVLAVATYKVYKDKQIITPAIDLEMYDDYVKPSKALQDLMAIKRVLKEIETEPIKPSKAAAKYTYDTLMSKIPATVTISQMQSQNNGAILNAKSNYTSTVLAKIVIGPRGGLTYEMADEKVFIKNIVSKFDVIARKLIEVTMLDAPADIGQAYETLIACVKEGKAVPERQDRVKLHFTGDCDETGASKNIVVNLMAKDTAVGSFGECVGNMKTRRLSNAHIADIVIPKAATIGVYIATEITK